MRIIGCPNCSARLQVTRQVAGATRPCPYCRALIQFPSEHNPIPAHRAHSWQQTEPSVLLVSGATFAVVMFCFVLAAFVWNASSDGFPSGAAAGGVPLPLANSGFAGSVPVVLECNHKGLKGQIKNNSGVALSRVAIVVNVFESDNSTPIITCLYHLEPAGSIARGETVDWQIPWRHEDGKVYAKAKGRLAARAEVSSLVGADGQPLFGALP